ncbi:Nucleotide-binding [Emericellopsis cladophorae]|uniref:Nucleotide-binding n=1 Tax=Emericellopsis cladophorae TaxID=2686198 RepID=A0A9P9XZ72_9HYPO|nr:Nucleotide-binding [Emericellopsis cladophorae]KAI6780596.1 Nucleotide-binding [Emericellopsis cladophorae]
MANYRTPRKKAEGADLMGKSKSFDDLHASTDDGTSSGANVSSASSTTGLQVPPRGSSVNFAGRSKKSRIKTDKNLRVARSFSPSKTSPAENRYTKQRNLEHVRYANSENSGTTSSHAHDDAHDPFVNPGDNDIRKRTFENENSDEGNQVVRSRENNHEMPPGTTLDAQMIYRPSACAFVANLNREESVDVLREEVTRAFTRFGTVFVKIRRDPHKGNPYAFCQFTTDEAMETALSRGRGLYICDRPCRIERANANCKWVVMDALNSRITPRDATEVRDLMRNFGEIFEVERLSSRQKRQLGVVDGLLVIFKRFEKGRDVKSLQASLGKRYQIQLYESRADSYTRRALDPMEQYEQDSRSAWVGNLPGGVTELELENEFECFGQVYQVDLRQKIWFDDDGRPIPGREGAFAFIVFLSPDAVDRAIEGMGDVREAFPALAERDHEAGPKGKTPNRPARVDSAPNVASSEESSAPSAAGTANPCAEEVVQEAGHESTSLPGSFTGPPALQQYGIMSGQGGFIPLDLYQHLIMSGWLPPYPGQPPPHPPPQ